MQSKRVVNIMWACSIKVEAVLLAASVSFFCPVMLNWSRNSDMNKTSTRYKVIILFWRLEGKTNIDVRTFEPSFVFADEASKAVFPPSSQP